MSKQVNLRTKLNRNDAPQPASKADPLSRRAPASAPAPIPTTSEEDLVRKEFRIRPDQHAALASLRRRINSTRTAAEKNLSPDEKSPSMTDRILARVALDYLLEHADQLTGWTEQDLLESLRKATD